LTRACAGAGPRTNARAGARNCVHERKEKASLIVNCGAAGFFISDKVLL
jgi:hypothetical protein